jgi:hypothetical protein
VQNADFSPFCLTVPVDSRLPDGGGNQLCGFYDISPAKLGLNDNVISQAAHFGKQSEIYDGYDFTGNARLSHGIMMSGGVTMGRAHTDNCALTSDLSLAYAGSATGVTASRTSPFCDVQPPMLPNIKFLAVYPIPFWELQASGTWQSTPGPEITASYAATNAEIAPSLGRDLSSGRNSTVLVDLVPKGASVRRSDQPGGSAPGQDLPHRQPEDPGHVRPLQRLQRAALPLHAEPFGPAWQTPTSVLIGRLAKFAVSGRLLREALPRTFGRGSRRGRLSGGGWRWCRRAIRRRVCLSHGLRARSGARARTGASPSTRWRLSRIRVERRVDVSGTLAADDLVRVSSQVAGIVSEVAVELGGRGPGPAGLLVRLEPRELALAVERAESACGRWRRSWASRTRARGHRRPTRTCRRCARPAATRDDAAYGAGARGINSPRASCSRGWKRNRPPPGWPFAEASHQTALDAARSLPRRPPGPPGGARTGPEEGGGLVIRSPGCRGGGGPRRTAGRVHPREHRGRHHRAARPLILQTAIQERHAGLIRADQPVDFVVEAFPGQIFKGTVAFVGPDGRSGHADLPGGSAGAQRRSPAPAGLLRQGHGADPCDDQVLAVPDAAVSALAGVSTVFVIEDGKARQQEVTVGAAQVGLVEIVAGLKGTERLATTNLNQLATGAAVRTSPAP